MQLNKFQAVAKKRTGWEAIDLGCEMARAWFYTLWLLWLLPASLCLLLLSFVFHSDPIYAGLITWLLKPVWERPLLYVASQQLFAERLSKKEMIASLFKANKKDWFWWITLRRILPSRAYLMPVTVLEGLKGSVRSGRVSLLQRRFSSPATWLIISAVHIEFFILMAIFAGVGLLLPSGVELRWQSILFEYSTLYTHVYNVAWLLAASIIAPFYVCSGFSLYLQRRIDLEAWDIEIQFRQLASRIASRKLKSTILHSNSLVLVFLSIFTISFCFAPQQLRAADFASVKSNSEQVPIKPNSVEDDAESRFSEDYISDGEDGQREEISRWLNEIYSNEPFYHIKVEKKLDFKKDEDTEDTEVPNWLLDFADWLENYGSFFKKIADVFRDVATLIEILLWLGLFSIIALLIWRYRNWLAQSFAFFNEKSSSENTAAPKTLFGIALDEEPLPSDVLKEINELWDKGQARKAFSLLLRAIILVCIQNGCKFKDGHTEAECAKIVSSQLKQGQTESFDTLIRYWQELAYAHRLCSDEVFTKLCSDYSEYWQSA